MPVCDRRLVLGCIVLTALLVHLATWSMFGWHHRVLPQMHPIPPPLSQSPVSIKPAYEPAGVALAPPLRPTHVLPRNVPCTEFSDLDAAHARCENESSEPAIHCPRASGMEAACVSSAAAVETDCTRMAAARAAGTPANSSLDWGAVAFAMATYDAEFERQMLQVGAETWMRMTVGADLVLGIDLDDPRKHEEIRPSWGHTEPPLQVHIFRCPICCSGGRPTPGSARARQVSVSKADSPCKRTPPAEGFVREGWKASAKRYHERFAPDNLLRLPSALGEEQSDLHLAAHGEAVSSQFISSWGAKTVFLEGGCRYNALPSPPPAISAPL